MELTTIVGLVIGAICIVFGILGQGNLIDYWDAASVFIVLGGILAATVVNYSYKDLKKLLKIIPIAFKKFDYNLYDTVYKIIDLANIARKDSLLALDNKAREIEDPFLKKGVMLVVDGTDPEQIRNIMETEIVFMEDRHEIGHTMLLSMSAYAPAFGMIGTLVGLIGMLKNLNDAATLGAGMSTALITTFYGCILANLIFAPLAGKLKTITDEEVKYYEMILEGLLSIQAGENPRLIEEKLLSFISKSEQNIVNNDSEQGSVES